MVKHVSNYSKAQIALHWVVVLGVIFQIAFHEFIVEAMQAFERGESVGTLGTVMAYAHVASGSLIFLAVVTRIVLRIRRGVPDHAPSTPALAARLSSLMHNGLYAVLLAMVVTGGMTFNAVADLGRVHWALNIALVVMIAGHVAAALWNQYVRKDGTLARMIPALNKFGS
ncbi:cytochrome b/b6 domain-containing protein [Devosia neptuniae]|jgi:cytochrome b561|uniref:cytochrome b n=1 Tax=Devosia TaxID=46913 RepID=UPI0022AFA451|nr:cytochrome b/b6 domain-containing protein [Devosia neptuniae]MCZ4347033.1 cytochrome b/b6 domain-containing protein [Devosia neptuniae]|tara:strand:- start:5057 stop:5566 length:510 start_codon:yes stop_codon:yes gene_type:complete